MNTSLICTFISPDRSGLIEELSKIVAHCSGNWLDSSMAQLAGQFTGIIRIDIDENKIEPLTAQLKALEEHGMLIQIKSALSVSNKEQSENGSETNSENADLKLSIIGNDRPGIIQEVSYALAQAGLNVLKMEIWLSSAPMSGDPMFNAAMRLSRSIDTDIEELKAGLEAIAITLAIEIDLENE